MGVGHLRRENSLLEDEAARAEERRGKLSPMQKGKLQSLAAVRSEFATYGFALSQFSMIEFALLGIFIFVDQRPVERSISKYWEKWTPNSRVKLIDSRMRERRRGDRLAHDWSDVHQRILKAIDLRNDLSHGEFAPIMVSEETALVGYWAYLAKSATTGRISVNDDLTMIDGVKFFSTDDLIDHGLEFIALSEELFTILDRAKTDVAGG